MYTTRGKQVPSKKGKFIMAIKRTDRVKIQQYGDDLGRTFTDIQTAPTGSTGASCHLSRIHTHWTGAPPKFWAMNEVCSETSLLIWVMAVRHWFANSMQLSTHWFLKLTAFPPS